MKKTILSLVLSAFCSLTFLSAQITSPAPYCVATFDDVPFNVSDAIKSVSLGTLTNLTNTQCAAPHYIYYNNLTAPNLIKGTTYTLTVIFDVKGGAGYGVWIDYNNNNTFETSEKVAGTVGSTSLDITTNTTITKSITIPANATTGITRMRVRIVEDDNYTQGTNYAILPCNASTSATDIMDWGETEDYNINITAANGINENKDDTQFSIYPNPANDYITISYNNNNINALNIFNMQGQEVLSKVVDQNESTININVSSLFSGIYFLQLQTDKGIVNKKFIVNR